MNKALFLISLQHELAMSIGNKLDLKAMLKVFLKVCFNRLNLNSGHIYLFRDPIDETATALSHHYINPQHFLSIPKKTQGQDWPTNIALTDFVLQLNNANSDIYVEIEENHFFYGFVIPNHGLLIFETNYVLDLQVRKALLPILKKLATSCYTSLVHDSLVKEIHNRQQIEEKIAYQAQHDGLTGLFNRHHLHYLLTEAINDAHTNEKVGCVIFLDLNRFKPINDAMGHTIGDKILITFSNRLQSLSSQHLDVARFGGDEFIVLLKNLDENYQTIVTETVEKINQLIGIPFVIASNSFLLNASIGYSLFPLQSSTVNNLIKYADIAMYEAKRTKDRRGKQYSKSMSEKIRRRLAYVDDMKRGLKNGDFQLYYQPQYNHLNEIIGAEALLRWQHPKYGMESPAVYIPIAEESDLILKIGQFVLEQACLDIYQLEQISLPESFLKVAINVSAMELIQHNFQENILKTINAYKISSHRLSLELTENLLVENIDESIALIASLKNKQIECSIDDFGTGYSSLTYLKRIPASLLKIDRSFVTNIHKSKESIAIANMIISLGKTLNMNILAEGVETQAELDCLKELGCLQYQGYYFSKPVPFDELKRLLQQKTASL